MTAAGTGWCELHAHAGGLECLTGCRHGRVAAALLQGDEQGARATLEHLCAIFGAAHTWVEVQRPDRHDDRRLSFGLARLAHRTGLGLVATGNAHYARSDDRDLQDVLVCIRHRVPLAADRPYLRPGASWHLRSPGEMACRFADLPAALPTATVVEVVGQVIARQQPPTAKGVLFLGLSDATGLLNVVVPPSVYQRDRAVARGRPCSGSRGCSSGGAAGRQCAPRSYAPWQPSLIAGKHTLIRLT